MKMKTVLVEKSVTAKLKNMLSSQFKKYDEGFFKKAELHCIESLYKNLNEFMSPEDLLKAILSIESIEIVGKKGKPFEQYLATSNLRTLAVLGFDDKNANDIVFNKEHLELNEKSTILPFLSKFHGELLNCYELAYLHAREEIPVATVSYDEQMLAESQIFNEMILTSKEYELNDKATIVKDIVREGVTINGQVIKAEDVNNSKDPYIILAIEKLTGDKVDFPGSKANKIFHFGGQFLAAICMEEFVKTSNLSLGSSIVKSGLTGGMTKGHIDWKKDDKGSITADVKVKIFTVNQIDILDKKDNGRLYAIGTDGLSMSIITDHDIESVLPRIGKEIHGKTEHNVVPIAEVSLTLEFDQDLHNKKEHFLKPQSACVKYYTPDLVSKHVLDRLEAEQEFVSKNNKFF